VHQRLKSIYSQHLVPQVEEFRLDYFLTDAHTICLKMSWQSVMYADVRIYYHGSEGTPMEMLAPCGRLDNEGMESEIFVAFKSSVYFYDDNDEAFFLPDFGGFDLSHVMAFGISAAAAQ